ISAADVLALQAATREVRVDPGIADYILDLVEATRTHPEIVLGASTRAALALYRAAQAHAVTDGREYAVPADVKALAEPVLPPRGGGPGGGPAAAAPALRETPTKRRVPPGGPPHRPAGPPAAASSTGSRVRGWRGSPRRSCSAASAGSGA